MDPSVVPPVVALTPEVEPGVDVLVISLVVDVSLVPVPVAVTEPEPVSPVVGFAVVVGEVVVVVVDVAVDVPVPVAVLDPSVVGVVWSSPHAGASERRKRRPFVCRVIMVTSAPTLSDPLPPCLCVRHRGDPATAAAPHIPPCGLRASARTCRGSPTTREATC